MNEYDLIVIKFGALGDVVRTSYIIGSYVKQNKLKKVAWITSPKSLDLVKNISFIHTFTPDVLPYDLSTRLLLSLDDEFESVSLGRNIRADKVIGTYISSNNLVSYTDDSSLWFDMGLISKFGKTKADLLKKNNTLSHAEIFSQILNIKKVFPFFYNDIVFENKWSQFEDSSCFTLGFNPFAGPRWPSKELINYEFFNLISECSIFLERNFKNYRIVLFHDESNSQRTLNISNNFPNIQLINTSSSVLDFASAIKLCDYVISTDSLGLHLAIAQSVPNLSYYAPTSAVEIDTFGTGVKVLSTSPDYCTYKPYVDNSSLTSERIINYWTEHLKELGHTNA